MSAAPPYPRVSLVLIAFDQERFVGEAVRSVLAQDYPNLQVILSDDHSSDATFATMTAMADDYEGPHEVLARRPERNLGLVRHLYDAAALATGELVVAAAGDDLSYPHRVSRLAAEWRSSGATALFSDWDEIDDAGCTVRHGRPPGRSDLRLDHYFPGWQPRQIIGATSAYSREALANIPCPAKPIFAEDLYLTLMLSAWRRPIAYVDEPLVGYRTHAGALTHTDRPGETVAADETRVARESARIAEVLDAFADTAASIRSDWGAIGGVDWDIVREDAEFNRFRAGWIETSVFGRLRALGQFSAPSHRRWLLPRILGLPVLAAIKRFAARRRSPHAATGRRSAGSRGPA